MVSSLTVSADMKKEEPEASIGVVSMDEGQERTLVRRIDFW